MQRPRVYNKRDARSPADAVYVGRPSDWGNPYFIGHHGSREECVEKFREHIKQNRSLMARIGELKGKNLVCWCAPKACHGDVLLELANETPSEVPNPY